MEAPPQSTNLVHTRLCSQMEAPPQSLHLLLRRLCSQMEAPPQSLQTLLCRLCSQMEAPPQSLQTLLRRLCSHKKLRKKLRLWYQGRYQTAKQAQSKRPWSENINKDLSLKPSSRRA